MPGLVGSTQPRGPQNHYKVEDPPPKQVQVTGDNFLTRFVARALDIFSISERLDRAFVICSEYRLFWLDDSYQ